MSSARCGTGPALYVETLSRSLSVGVGRGRSGSVGGLEPASPRSVARPWPPHARTHAHTHTHWWGSTVTPRYPRGHYIVLGCCSALHTLLKSIIMSGLAQFLCCYSNQPVARRSLRTNRMLHDSFRGRQIDIAQDQYVKPERSRGGGTAETEIF
jgi:hypothetical protein